VLTVTYELSFSVIFLELVFLFLVLAVSQAVSCRHLTAEAPGRSQVTSCEIVVMVEEAPGQVFLQLI